MKIITRSQVLEKLDQWSSGALSPIEMMKWAAQVHLPGNVDFEDWEKNHSFSVTKEVIAELESIDINLLIKEDIPIFIRFLNTPKDQFEAGYIPFIAALQNIDKVERVDALRDMEPYSRHCKSL